MAKKAKREAEHTDATETTVAGNVFLNTLPGETHGLAVTAPAETTAEPAIDPEVETEAAIDPEDFELDQSDLIDPVVSADIPSDPAANVAAALVALGRFYNQAGIISEALSKHLRGTAGEPELHGFLHRTQILLGEFRHTFEQNDAGMSEQLRDAIQDALAA